MQTTNDTVVECSLLWEDAEVRVVTPRMGFRLDWELMTPRLRQEHRLQLEALMVGWRGWTPPNVVETVVETPAVSVYVLGGGFKYMVFFHPYLGKMNPFWLIFFNWVENAN